MGLRHAAEQAEPLPASTPLAATTPSNTAPCPDATTNSASTSSMRPYQIVVAAARNMGIGRQGGLPWNLPGDMAYFRELTSKTSTGGSVNAVIMGRKTWDSIPPKFR